MRFACFLICAKFWLLLGCKPVASESGHSLSSTDEIMHTAEEYPDLNEEALAFLNSPEAIEAFYYDHELIESRLTDAMPSMMQQKLGGFDLVSYMGEGYKDFFDQYKAALAEDPEFKTIIDELIEMGRIGVQMQNAMFEYRQNAQGTLTNTIFGKGYKAWFQMAEDVEKEFNAMRDEYERQGLSSYVVLGWSNDPRSKVAGGTGFEAATAAARAADFKEHHGITSEGAGPIEFVLGGAPFKIGLAAMGKLAVRSGRYIATTRTANFILRGGTRGSMTTFTRGARLRITNIFRRCSSLRLSLATCANVLEGNLKVYFKSNVMEEITNLGLLTKFQNAVKHGIVAPQGKSGIKRLSKKGFYEVKIYGSNIGHTRILGFRTKDGYIVFTELQVKGLNKSGASNKVIEKVMGHAAAWTP